MMEKHDIDWSDLDSLRRSVCFEDSADFNLRSFNSALLPFIRSHPDVVRLVKAAEKVEQYFGSGGRVTLEYLTPANEMRHHADLLEAKDAAIKEFKEALANLQPEPVTPAVEKGE